jgi:hypothetical protein
MNTRTLRTARVRTVAEEAEEEEEEEEEIKRRNEEFAVDATRAQDGRSSVG